MVGPLDMRAENYSRADLDHLLDFKSESYENYSDTTGQLIDRLRNNYRDPILLYGGRGCGKTMAILLALRYCISHDHKDGVTGADRTIPIHIIYKRRGEFEILERARIASEDEWGDRPRREGVVLEGEHREVFDGMNVVVIDDIHYAYDDVRYEGHKDKHLVDLLETALELSASGCKVILVSEDSLSPTYCAYLKDERFEKILASLGITPAFTKEYWDLERSSINYPIIPPDPQYILDIHDIKSDPYVVDFFERNHSTPRTIVDLAQRFGTNDRLVYTDLVHAAQKRINRVSPKGRGRLLLGADAERLVGLKHLEFRWVVRKLATDGVDLRGETVRPGKVYNLLSSERSSDEDIAQMLLPSQWAYLLRSRVPKEKDQTKREAMARKVEWAKTLSESSAGDTYPIEKQFKEAAMDKHETSELLRDYRWYIYAPVREALYDLLFEEQSYLKDLKQLDPRYIPDEVAL